VGFVRVVEENITQHAVSLLHETRVSGVFVEDWQRRFEFSVGGFGRGSRVFDDHKRGAFDAVDYPGGDGKCEEVSGREDEGGD
jgi:hypothetical protein